MNSTSTRANGTLLTMLYIIGFIISGCFTAKCLISFGQDKVSKLLFMGMTILFEFGKGFMFFEFASNRHKGKMKQFFLTMWLGLLFMSLFASMGLAVNESNKTSNNTIKNSTEYKMQNEQYKLHKDNIKSAQDELNKLNTTNIDEVIVNDETLKSLRQNKESAIKKNYISHPTLGANHYQDLITEKENKLRDNYNNRKKELEALIAENGKELEKNTNSVSKISSKGIKDTSGYKAILGIIVDFFNKTGIYLSGKWTTEQLELCFYFIMSLLLELIICTLYFLKKYYQMIDAGEIVIEREPIVIRQKKKTNPALPNYQESKQLPQELQDQTYKVNLEKKKYWNNGKNAIGKLIQFAKRSRENKGK